MYIIPFAFIFRCYSALMIFLRIAVCAELYGRILEHFPGVNRNFGSALAGSVLIVGAVLSLATFRPDFCRLVGLPNTFMFTGRRYVSEILTLALGFSWIFFRWLLLATPVFANNARSHWKILLAYLSIATVHDIAVVHTGGGAISRPLDAVMLAGDLLCFLFWILAFRKSGECIAVSGSGGPEFARAEREFFEFVDFMSELPQQISDRLGSRRGRR